LEQALLNLNRLTAKAICSEASKELSLIGFVEEVVVPVPERFRTDPDQIDLIVTGQTMQTT
jgi:hypothetical protein